MSVTPESSHVVSAGLLSQLIAANTASLRAEIFKIRLELDAVTNSNTVTEYKTQTVDSAISCIEPLDIIKSLPEFNGDETQYVSWREAAHNSIFLYTKGSRRYFAALTILRNKITGNANDTLTNHGTVLNLDAIMSRLDFAYADKRPLHIIEQQLSVLRQGSMTILEYYNIVNKTLTMLINKTIMTHGSNSTLATEMNLRHRQNALRIFITGLNPPLANILFSLGPEDLPNALAKAQELESNNLRANFAFQFSKNNNSSNRPQNNLRYAQKQQQNSRQNVNTSYNNPRYENAEPMEIDTSANVTQYSGNRTQNRYNNNSQNWHPDKQNYGNNYSHRQYSQNHQNRLDQPYPNGQNSGEKRQYQSGQVSQQPQNKTQRVNNLNEPAFLCQNEDCPTFSGQSAETLEN